MANLWDYPELYKEPDPSTISSILRVLGYLDYPRNAIATGIKNTLDEDPESGFFGGLREGWGGPQVSNLNAVAGTRMPDESDDWPTWLGLSAAHFGSDLIDPTFGIGKAAKGVRAIPAVASKIDKWSDAAADSKLLDPLYRMFSHGFRKDADNQALAASKFAATEKVNDAVHTYSDVAKEYKAFEEAYPGGPLQLGNDYSRGVIRDIPPEFRGILDTLWGARDVSTDRQNVLREALGLTTIDKIQDAFMPKHIPDVRTNIGNDVTRRNLDNMGRNMSTGQIEADQKELKLFVDKDDFERGVLNPLTTTTGRKLVSKPQEYYGVKSTGEQGIYDIERSGIETQARAVQPTLLDKMEAKIGFAPEHYVQSPADALVIDLMKKGNQEGFLTFLNSRYARQAENMAGRDLEDMFSAYNKGLSDKPLVEIKKFEDIYKLPKNYVLSKIPGMEHIAGPRSFIRDLEKQAKRLYNPDTPLGWIEQLGEKITSSEIGRLFSEGTQWWKNNVLAHPATVMGNIISNIPQMYLGGVNPFVIPYRAVQAAAIQMGKGKPVFEGFSNKQLARMFEDAGVFESTWGAVEGKKAIEEALGTKGRVRQLADQLPGPLGTAVEGVGRAGEWWGKNFNQNMLKVVQGQSEANAKISVAIDWLKRNVNGAPTKDDILRAVSHAKNVMIDYSALTPAEKTFAQIIPFYAWQRGLLGRTAEVLLENPERLARYSRSLNYTFTPMSEEDRMVADPWMREAAPTKGMMGTSWDDIWQKVGDWSGLSNIYPEAFAKSPMGDRYTMIGRYIPQGNIEQMYSRPLDFMQSSLNPLLKVPMELMMNRSFFKDRPIDPIAGSFPNALTAPFGSTNLYSEGQTKPFGLSMPAAYEYLLGQIPGGRNLMAASELGRSFGAWSDEYKPETSPPEALTSYLSGFKSYPFDKEKAIGRRKREVQIRERDIKSQLKYAMSKGDYVAVDHYYQALDDIAKEKQRAIGQMPD